MNVTCSPQSKWRPYTPQLIYTQSFQTSDNNLLEEPRYNLFKDHHMFRYQRGFDCLEALNIDFDELNILRVHKKPYVPKSLGFAFHGHSRIELLFGSSAGKNHRATFLQSQILINSHTVSEDSKTKKEKSRRGKKTFFPLRLFNK